MPKKAKRQLNGHTVNRVKTVADAESYTLTYSYDNFDRVTQILYPDSTTETFSYVNPATGNVDLDLHSSTDRLGRTTRKYYDSVRHLISEIDPLGRTTKYGWCTCGNMISMTDPKGNVTQYNRDGESRLTSKVYADSTATSYTYDTLGRLATVTDARGDVTTNSYNLDNTISGISYSLASGTAATPNVSYGYDSFYPRLTSEGGVTLSYYAPGGLGADQVETVTNTLTGGSAAITYTYDEWGRRVGSNIDGANSASLTFDSLGEVTNVTNLLGSFNFGYYDPTHPTGRLGSITYPSGTGLSTSYSYFGNTGDERLQTIQNLTGGSTNISKFAYTYNAVGTIASMTQTNDSSTAIVNTYGYDNADQLTGDTQSGGATSTYGYNYDLAGNRLAETINSTTTAGAFNNLNQLVRTGSGVATTIAGSVNKSVTLTIDGQSATLDGSNHFSLSLPLPGGTNTVPLTATDSLGNQTTNKYQFFTTGSTVTPTYDADGNMLTDENGNSYQWDAKNELAKITSGSNTYQFAYDSMGHRISETDNSTLVKQWVWDGSTMVEERNASNAVQKRFYAQGEQISGGNYYYTRDHLGSVREMTDSSGTIQARYDYDPYGRTTLVSGTNLSDFQYAGYYMHQTSGLYLTKYRAYDPNTARWLSRDPIGIAGGINLYGYVGNNPIFRIDLFGLTDNSSEAQSQADAASFTSSTPFDDTTFGGFSLFNLTNGNLANYLEESALLGGSKFAVAKGLAKACPDAAPVADALPPLATGATVLATIADAIQRAMNSFFQSAMQNQNTQNPLPPLDNVQAAEASATGMYDPYEPLSSP